MKAQVLELGTANERVSEVEALQQRLDELREDLVKLDPIWRSLKVLADAEIHVRLSPQQARNARSKLAEISARFAKERTSTALTRGQSWRQMREAIQNTAQAATATAFESWRDYVRSRFSGERPEDLRATLAPTESNTKTRPLYEREFLALQALAAQLPDGMASIDAVEQHSKALQTIATRFERDVPLAVKTFLDAVIQGGASLALIDAEVLRWLETNNSRDRYQVVGRR